MTGETTSGFEELFAVCRISRLLVVERRALKRILPNERGDCLSPVGYALRTLDREWIIPDNRVLNRPNPELWKAHSNKQV